MYGMCLRTHDQWRLGGMILLEAILGVIGIGEENTPFERGICTLAMGRLSLRL